MIAVQTISCDRENQLNKRRIIVIGKKAAATSVMTVVLPRINRLVFHSVSIRIKAFLAMYLLGSARVGRNTNTKLEKATAKPRNRKPAAAASIVMPRPPGAVAKLKK